MLPHSHLAGLAVGDALGTVQGDQRGKCLTPSGATGPRSLVQPSAGGSSKQSKMHGV